MGLVTRRDATGYGLAYDHALIRNELVQLRYQASLQSGITSAYEAMFPESLQQHIVTGWRQRIKSGGFRQRCGWAMAMMTWRFWQGLPGG